MTPRRPNLLIGVSLFVSVAIFLISALVLVEMRQDALRRAQEAATNLSLIVERDTSRNLEIYDLSLQAVIDGLQEPGLNKLPPLMKQKVLFDRAASAKDLGALLVVDESGNVIIDSRSFRLANSTSQTVTTSRSIVSPQMSDCTLAVPSCLVWGKEVTPLRSAADFLMQTEPLPVLWSAHFNSITSVICSTA
ncbi:hypothetical protein GGD41_006079 [Paraburkholderia bryophila]|uniref:Uncharacterized protein n=1 Tax=Paraburkholderia bryophila TaxID=420952 RepID=A0A7Y9WDJ1_9BURK|nr:hypothetical protein [Paraburkholderia bryophila]